MNEIEKDKITLADIGGLGKIELLDPVPGTRFRIGASVYMVRRGGCGACSPSDYALATQPPKCAYSRRGDHGVFLVRTDP